MKILIPKQVIREIKGIDDSNSKLFFKILKKNKFKEIDLGKGKVDNLIINFAKENKEIIVATLDREIKRKIQNSRLVIRGKKNLEVL